MICERITTANTLLRRVAKPPLKSATPQDAAEHNP